MQTRKLSAEQLELLEEVVRKHLPEDAERLLGESPERWQSSDRNRVRDAIGEEVAETGFDAGYEPTARGHLLESLIDFVNRLEPTPKTN